MGNTFLGVWLSWFMSMFTVVMALYLCGAHLFAYRGRERGETLKDWLANRWYWVGGTVIACLVFSTIPANDTWKEKGDWSYSSYTVNRIDGAETLKYGYTHNGKQYYNTVSYDYQYPGIGEQMWQSCWSYVNQPKQPRYCYTQFSLDKKVR